VLKQGRIRLFLIGLAAMLGLSACASADVIRLRGRPGEEPASLRTLWKIVLTSLRDGNWEIYVMDADGSNLVRLTDDPAVDWVRGWSPVR
jgi:hypothetical protein